MCSLNFRVKRSKVTITICIDSWKCFLCIITLPLHVTSWNFTQRLTLSRGYALLISGSKGQRSRLQCIDSWKWFLRMICLSSHLDNHETSHTNLVWVDDVPYRYQGQKVKGQGHNALITENGFWRITVFLFNLQLSNLTHTHTHLIQVQVHTYS